MLYPPERRPPPQSLLHFIKRLAGDDHNGRLIADLSGR